MNHHTHLHFSCKKIFPRALSALLLAALLAGCGGTGSSAPAAGSTAQGAASAADTARTEAPSSADASDSSSDAAGEASTKAIARVATNLKGETIEVPMQVNQIISLAPSTTQLLIDLGVADKIAAVDTYSLASYADALPADIPAFDMMAPDNEQIVALRPDIVFTTGMSYAWGEDVFASAREAGVFIIDIDSPASLREIIDSIVFIGECVKETTAAREIAAEMEAFLEEVRAVMAGTELTVKKTVLFELSTPTPDFPTIYSVGPGSYIDEIISLVGGENIASDADSPWPVLTEEAAIGKNPDVILSADNYTPDVTAVIAASPGWENVSAVTEQQLYLLDADRINRPNHHVCGAILEIGLCLYPELFEALENPFEDALPDAA